MGSCCSKTRVLELANAIHDFNVENDDPEKATQLQLSRESVQSRESKVYHTIANLCCIRIYSISNYFSLENAPK